MNTQDFVLNPTRGLLNRPVSRVVTFGKRSYLPPGMLSAALADPAPVRAAQPAQLATEQAESTVLDFFAVMLFSHVVGLLAHCHLLGKALESGIEANDSYRKGPGKAPGAAAGGSPTGRVAAFGPRRQAGLKRSTVSFGRR
ncbi:MULTISPECIES: hypothetical protein [Burkholderia]|uniref:hypothetical protein n=1 Tax=Burkholderia TaxID=32008 RepID=UPI001906668C|nr:MULTISPECIES: hypothetical protein [Burkholderia]MBJ9920655.1 hypothetical protein [Burkholderia cenocepacia]UVS90914.1 hypothetical protein EFP17_14710 [Burkholderia glumae]